MVESIEFYRRKWDVTRNIRRNDDDRIFSALPTDSSVEGEFLVDGPGEALKQVNFPVRFIERPNFTTGGELNLDSFAVAGSYPTVSCTINKWFTDPPIVIGTTSDFSKVYFIGAELSVVSTGPTGQRMWIHWRASGKGIVSPDSDDSLTTSSVI